MLTAVVVAFVALHHPDSLGAKTGLPNSAQATADSFDISPVGWKSGHKITPEGKDSFVIENRFGRWAICHTPNEEFFLYPNGRLLDLIRPSTFGQILRISSPNHV